MSNNIIRTTNAILIMVASAILMAVNADAAGFSAAKSLATAREHHTGTLLSSGKVLIAGGKNSGGSLSSAELYNPATNTWSPAGSMATARADHTATLLSSGKVLVVGGTGGGSTIASAELYDPATNTWSPAGSMTTARTVHTATRLSSGKVLVVGGADISGGAFASTELYDPASNTWSTSGPLTAGRYYHTATLLASGKVLVVGGVNFSSNIVYNATEVYDPARGSWTSASPMTSARMNHTATLLAGGKVLVAGGADNDLSTISSAELYDPVGNSWSSAGTMATVRSYHTATVLPNGKALVAGGVGRGTLSSAELYDPTGNSWTSAGNMTAARNSHTATLLSNGKVLMAGGDDSGGALASVDLYVPSDSLTVSVSGSGTVTSSPGGISCRTTGCTADFDQGTVVQLFSTADDGFTLSGWGGVCTGTGACSVTMNANKSVTATFAMLKYIRIGTVYYPTLQNAFDAAINGNTIQAQAKNFTDLDLVFSRSGAQVKFKGGYDSNFSTNSGYTVLDGKLSIRGGTLRVEKLKIK